MTVQQIDEAPVDRAARRTYLLGTGVVVIFIVVNLWVAFDHLRGENRSRRQVSGVLEGTQQLAAQRAALLGASKENGPIDLQKMRDAGVRVPDGFVREGEFASPWGPSQIIKQGDRLIWDFYGMTVAGCTQLLENSGTIAGVFRVASSSLAADEISVPLTRETIAHECRRTGLLVRLILK